MPIITVNYLAVLVAAVASMVIGYIWYGPLFAKPWMKEVGKTEAELKKNATGGLYGLTFVGSLITAYVMAHFVGYAQASDIVGGLITGFWAWLGFVATTMLSIKLFESRSWNLYGINVGYYLATFLVMGAILATWH